MGMGQQMVTGEKCCNELRKGSFWGSKWLHELSPLLLLRLFYQRHTCFKPEPGVLTDK